MKPGGDQTRRPDGADRTASVWLRATGRNDDRPAPAVWRKPPMVQRKDRKPGRK